MVFPYFFRFVRVPVVVIVAVAVGVVAAAVDVAVVVYLVVLGGTRRLVVVVVVVGCSKFEERGVRKITTGITALWRPSVHSDAF